MFRRLFAAFLALACCLAGATDVNTATRADLESVKGLGPATAARILDARAQGPFHDWPDFVARVSGIGASSARRLSSQGLTVNGARCPGTDPPASGASP